MTGNELQKRILSVLKKVSKENNTQEVQSLIEELQSSNNLIIGNSKVEEQLKNSELNLKTLINNKDESIWSIDSNYNYIIFNEYFEKQYFSAYKTKLKVGISAIDILSKDIYEFWKANYDTALSGKKIEFEFEIKVGKKNRCFKVSLNPIISDKNITGVSALSVDITDRKKDYKKLRASEDMLQLITKSSADVIFRINQRGKFLYFSESIERVFGYKPIEILGLNFREFIIKSEVKSAISKLRTAFISKQITDFTTKILHKNGHIVSVEINGNFIEKDGELIGQGSIRDITKRKEHDIKIRQNEENYREIFNTSSDAIYILNKSAKFLDVNIGAEKMYGYKKDHFIGKTPEFLSAPDKNNFKSVLKLIKNAYGGNKEKFEFWGVRKNGDVFPINIRLHPGNYNGERVVIATARDISDRKKIIQSMRDSKKKYKFIAEKASDVVWLVDLDGNSIFVTPSIVKFTGFTYKEYLCQTLEKRFTKDSATKAKIFLSKELKKYKLKKNINELPKKIILEYICKDKAIKTAEVIISPYYDTNGELVGIHGVTKDITEKIKSEVALKESEKVFQNLTQLIASAVFVYQDDKFVFVNKSTETISGYSEKELLNMNFWDVVHPDSEELVKQRGIYRQHGKKVESRYEFKLLKKDGSKVWIDFTGGSINWHGEKAGLGSAFDITESKKNEEELRKRTERYHAIADSTADYAFTAKILKNGNTQMDWVGGSFKKITGYTFDEFTTNGFWASLLHPRYAIIDNAALEELKSNRKIEIEIKIFDKKKETIWIRCSAKPVWNEKEKRVDSIHGAVKDISEEKNEELVKEIQFNIATAIVKVTSEEELFNSIKKELIKLIDAKNFFVALYDEDKDSFKAVLDNDKDKDKIITWKAEKSLTGMVIDKSDKVLLKKHEILALKKAKKIKVVGSIPEAWLGIPLLIGEKAIGAFVVQSYNNSKAYDKFNQDLIIGIASQLSLFIEKNRAKEVSSKLSKVIVQSPVSIIITNPNGDIEYVNPYFERVTGYLFDEVFGKNPKILKSNEHSEEFYRNLWGTILAGDPWQKEVLNKKKDGTLFWENVIIAPIINDKGIITHFVSHKEDVSEKKKMYDEIIEAKEISEKSEKMKSDFLTQISHEIRTPLNNILGNVGVLKLELNNLTKDDISDSFDIIDKSGSRLTRTIDLIINASDLQLGIYTPYINKINVVDILGQIKNEYTKFAENRSLKFSFKYQFNKKTIISDENAFFQIISNIINNAIKFTDIGSVKLVAEKGPKKELIIVIKDSGLGISEEFFPKLFDAYTQEEQGYTRPYDGNGLGLFLVKKYCEIIKAEITVKSKKGRGTTFTLKIPNLKLAE